LESPQALTREGITEFLQENPNLIDAWMQWSEDQRTSPAWWFAKTNRVYTVGLYPGGEEFTFTDRFDACAEFVIRQIESIARFAK
jgi:hypothetical protein